MSEHVWQFQRPNPLKPHVFKMNKDGMWWAAVNDATGNHYTDCFFTYEDALAKAREYAASNKEVSA